MQIRNEKGRFTVSVDTPEQLVRIGMSRGFQFLQRQKQGGSPSAHDKHSLSTPSRVASKIAVPAPEAFVTQLASLLRVPLVHRRASTAGSL